MMGEAEPLLVGNTAFRPTAIAAARDGSVYIADWADRRYPVHGKGRLWRLSVKANVPRLIPTRPFSQSNRDPQLRQLKSVIAGEVDSVESLLGFATGRDPFLSSAAVSVLSNPSYGQRMRSLMQQSDDPSIRLAALLALRDSVGELDAELLKTGLNDGDPVVRKMTMICIGEAMRFDLSDALLESMPLQTVSAALFETFLATSQMLSEAEAERVRQQIPGTRIDRSVDQALIRRFLENPILENPILENPILENPILENPIRENPVRESRHEADDVRTMAVRYLTIDNELDDATIGLLAKLATSEDYPLARESIRSLGMSPSPKCRDALLAIAKAPNRDASVRADAIASITPATASTMRQLLDLLRDREPRVALAAARAIGKPDAKDVAASGIRSLLAKVEDQPNSTRLAHQLRFAVGSLSAAERPQSDQQWMEIVEGGDPEAGARVSSLMLESAVQSATGSRVAVGKSVLTCRISPRPSHRNRFYNRFCILPVNARRTTRATRW